MAISAILDRFEHLKQTGPSRWLARCPAHDDKSPSLSIEDRNGFPLLHCFAGCEASAVLAAVGATWAEIMPEREGYQAAQRDKVAQAEAIHERETFLAILAHMVDAEDYVPTERELDKARRYQQDLLRWRVIR